jgi:hypothetical protein
MNFLFLYWLTPIVELLAFTAEWKREWLLTFQSPSPRVSNYVLARQREK